MPRRVGIRQVATAAGVSASTVSNVLNNPHVVRDDTRRRVLAAMADVGYVRNRAAQQLRGAPSNVVGCVVLDVANPFFSALVRGAEDRLAEASTMMLLCSSDVDVARERRYLRMLEEQGVRGILLNPVGPRMPEFARRPQREIPVVLLDYPRGTTGLCAAAVDNRAGGAAVARHLLDLGHRRMVFIGSQIDVRAVADRRAGIEEEMARVDLDPRDHLSEIREPRPADADVTDELIDAVLDLRPRPTAIICFNDAAALGAVRADHDGTTPELATLQESCLIVCAGFPEMRPSGSAAVGGPVRGRAIGRGGSHAPHSIRRASRSWLRSSGRRR